MIWVGLSSPMHSHARFITGQTTVTRRYLLSDLSTYYLLATIKQKHQLCSIFSDHERKAKMVSYIYAFDCVLCILLAVCHNYCYWHPEWHLKWKWWTTCSSHAIAKPAWLQLCDVIGRQYLGYPVIMEVAGLFCSFLSWGLYHRPNLSSRPP
jgi:hypothetical protein